MKVPKVVDLEEAGAKTEKFLKALAEEMEANPQQMMLIVRRRDRTVNVHMLRGWWSSEMIGLLEWAKMQCFVDYVEESQDEK